MGKKSKGEKVTLKCYKIFMWKYLITSLLFFTKSCVASVIIKTRNRGSTTNKRWMYKKRYKVKIFGNSSTIKRGSWYIYSWLEINTNSPTCEARLRVYLASHTYAVPETRVHVKLKKVIAHVETSVLSIVPLFTELSINSPGFQPFHAHRSNSRIRSSPGKWNFKKPEWIPGAWYR